MNATEHTITSQIDTYESIGYFQDMEITVDRAKQLLLEAASGLELDESTDFPVLVTFPESAISLEKRLALTGNRAFLESKDMHNRTKWATETQLPYLLTGIDFGRNYLEQSAQSARESLIMIGRTGLRLSELIDLSIFAPGVFNHTKGIRGLYAVETLHELDGRTTIVDLYQYGDTLKVKRDPEDITDTQWTTPSYNQHLLIT